MVALFRITKNRGKFSGGIFGRMYTPALLVNAVPNAKAILGATIFIAAKSNY